jgi:hypothetical protein
MEAEPEIEKGYFEHFIGPVGARTRRHMNKSKRPLPNRAKQETPCKGCEGRDRINRALAEEVDRLRKEKAVQEAA